MLTQDEYDEIMQRMADKEMMIDILRIKLSDMTADRNSYLELLDEHRQWIETMEAMLINTDFTSNTTTNSSKTARFFAPITRKLRALFGVR